MACADCVDLRDHGHPKGVVLSQRNVFANVDGVLARVHVESDWRFLSVLPLSHTYELTSPLPCSRLARAFSTLPA